MQTSELCINFRDGEDFFELLGIIYTKLVVYITVKVNVYTHRKTWRVRSGQGTWTLPDPPVSGPDPTRPAVLVQIPDPTRPNPTRPAGQPDPGTTLVHGPQFERFLQLLQTLSINQSILFFASGSHSNYSLYYTKVKGKGATLLIRTYVWCSTPV